MEGIENRRPSPMNCDVNSIPRVPPEVSSFSIKQTWRWTPPGVVDEIFDHFDLRTSNRLCRVSSAWSESLQRSAARNRGTAVFLWKRWRYPRVKNFEKVTEAFAWTSQLLVKEKSIKDLIFIGNSPQFTDDNNHGREYQNDFRSFPHPLNKITFVRNKLGIREFFKRTVVMLKIVSTVEFVELEVLLPSMSEFTGMFDLAKFRDQDYVRTMDFYLRTIAPRVRTARLSMTSSDFGSLSESGACLFDSYQPFGGLNRTQAEAQNRRWLISSLKSLRGGTLEALQLADAARVTRKVLVGESGDNDVSDGMALLVGLKTGASFDGRELTAFDCQFFAQLLWLLMDQSYPAHFYL